MSLIQETARSWTALQLSCGWPGCRADEMDDERYDCQDKQDVNCGAGHVHRCETKDPQQQENNEKGYKHIDSSSNY